MAGRARQEEGEERKGCDARRGMADKRKRALWWTWRKYADLFRLTDDRWRPRVERGKKRRCALGGQTRKVRARPSGQSTASRLRWSEWLAWKEGKKGRKTSEVTRTQVARVHRWRRAGFRGPGRARVGRGAPPGVCAVQTSQSTPRRPERPLSHPLHFRHSTPRPSLHVGRATSDAVDGWHSVWGIYQCMDIVF